MSYLGGKLASADATTFSMAPWHLATTYHTAKGGVEMVALLSSLFGFQFVQMV